MTEELQAAINAHTAKFNRAREVAVSLAVEAATQERYPESREILRRVQESDPGAWEHGFGPKTAADLLMAFSEAREIEERKTR